jgi:hypothetical protein
MKKVSFGPWRAARAALIGALGLALPVTARAEINLGAEATTVFDLGATSSLKDPAVGGTVVLGYRATDRLSLAAFGGHNRTDVVDAGILSGTFGASTLGGRLQYFLPGEALGTRPFAAVDLGYAHLRFDRTPRFEGAPAGLTSSHGWMVAPEFGLWTPLGRHSAVRVAARYQHTHALEALGFGGRTVNTFAAVALGLGLHLRL